MGTTRRGNHKPQPNREDGPDRNGKPDKNLFGLYWHLRFDRLLQEAARQILMCFSSFYTQSLVEPPEEAVIDDLFFMSLKTTAKGTAKLIYVNFGIF